MKTILHLIRNAMRRALVALAAASICSGTIAAPVPEATALRVARNLITHHLAVFGSWNGWDRAEIESIGLVVHQDLPVAYNVKVSPSGHLLLAYDDDLSPVILYSDQSEF